MKKFYMDLRLFDEGGGVSAGAVAGGGATQGGATQGGATQGAATQGAAPQASGAAPQASGAAPQASGTDSSGGEPAKDFDAEFEQLIKGDYKEQYNKRVQQIVKDRLKGSKQNETSLQEAREMLALVGERYGQDATDMKALRAAIENDRSYLEAEAVEKGMTVEQLSIFKQMERENKKLQATQAKELERQAFEEKFRGWQTEAEGIKDKYPALDLGQEFDNPNFVRLLDSGVGVQAAYQAIHFDELMQGALSHTAQEAQKKVMDSVRANGTRPPENGTMGSKGVSTKTDVTKLTKEERREIAQRVMRDPERQNLITFKS